ncbi:MAG: hypothetical protein KKH73_05830 [Actinobacteria bacterium]|nr:hypothetical protein [Actinomycetota bacterium]
MVMICPACGAENPDNSQYCNLCLECLGFENLEYTSTSQSGEGYLEQYPSSFQEGAGQAGGAPVGYGPEVEQPPAAPVDTGEYGERSGAAQADPVVADFGYIDYGHGGGEFQDVAARAFPWNSALLQCLYVSIAAAGLSVMLEIMMGFISVSFVMRGDFTMAQVWLLTSLLLPMALCGFVPGYRMEAYGWALGLISVGLWVFIMRPLYYGVLDWMFTERFTFSMAFDKTSLLFIFGLFLPLGALLGWLGEKRASTGLWL